MHLQPCWDQSMHWDDAPATKSAIYCCLGRLGLYHPIYIGHFFHWQEITKLSIVEYGGQLVKEYFFVVHPANTLRLHHVSRCRASLSLLFYYFYVRVFDV